MEYLVFNSENFQKVFSVFITADFLSMGRKSLFSTDITPSGMLVLFWLNVFFSLTSINCNLHL